MDWKSHDDVVLFALLPLESVGVVVGIEVAEASSVVLGSPEGHHYVPLAIYKAAPPDTHKQLRRSRLASGSGSYSLDTDPGVQTMLGVGKMQAVHKHSGPH